MKALNELLTEARRHMERTGKSNESGIELEWKYYQGRVEALEDLEALIKLMGKK